MNALVLALCCCVSADESKLETSPEASESLADSEPRPYHEINRDLRDWLLREATAQTLSERAIAVERLCDLFTELRKDPRLAESETLQSYQSRVRGRLRGVKKTLERQIKRQQRTKTSLLTAEEQVHHRIAETVGAQISTVSVSLGGPASLMAVAGQTRSEGAFGGGAGGDYGAELVALIQHTIDPEFWDVLGGPGTIYYYAPLHALVVRATAEVHRKIGGLNNALRAVGN